MRRKAAIPWPGAISGNMKKTHEDGPLYLSLSAIEGLFVPFRHLPSSGDGA
jgi:hypothetical protein